MLRDRRTALINDILTGLEQSASAFMADAEAASEREKAELLLRVSKRRSQQAERLEQQIRMLDGLPDAVDRDWEALARWMEHFVDESQRVRRHERNEGKLQARITEALNLDWPPSLQRLLQQLVDEISEDRQRLLERFG